MIDLDAFQARVMKLAADGKIPQEIMEGISQLIEKCNQLQTELNALRMRANKR